MSKHSHQSNGIVAKVEQAASNCGINVTPGAVNAIADQIKKIPPKTWMFTGLTILAGGIVAAIFTSIASGLTMLLTIVGIVLTGVGLYKAIGDQNIRAWITKFFPHKETKQISA